MARDLASAAFLAKSRSELLAGLETGGLQAVDLPVRLSAAVDDYFRRRLDEARDTALLRTPPFALLAVGGYGRRQLCPGSDIDVLLVHADDPGRAGGLETLASHLFHPLWDLRLSVGHVVRSISECLRLASADPLVLASLLDMRHVAGDKALFVNFQNRFRAEVAAPCAKSFANWLAARLPENGAPGLEPDLKNGPGGLRDAHRLGWLQMLFPEGGALFSPAERREIEAAASFLLVARVHLHAQSRSRSDILPQDLQPEAARRMGFPGGPGEAAQALAARLHEAMACLRAARQALLGSLLGRETPRPDPQADQWPESGFLVFLRMAFSGLPLSWQARRAVRQGVARAPGQAASAPMALSFLRRVLPAPHGAEALAAMLETGFLAALLPELGRAQGRVQFDGLHLHPVGVHGIETVRELACLARDAHLGALFEELTGRQRDALLLAGLLHDAGKDAGSDGHEERGAVLARDMLRRLGAPEALVEDVAFLVSSHLLLPVTAVRRDLGDETVAALAARKAGSLQRLTMLHLLGVADSKATGPRAWSGWKAALMGELYAKARRLLERGWLSTPHAVRKALATRDKVRSLATSGYGRDFVESALAAMPPRYVQVMDAATIVSHFPLVQEFRKALQEERTRVPHGPSGLGLTAMRARRLEGARAWEVTLAAMDQPGFFATVAGVMALHGLNILHAEIFTWSDGTVLDVFTVSEPPDSLQPEEVFERVRQGVKAALTGRLAVAERLAERRRSPLNRRDRAPGLPPEVRIDNEASDFHTLVEVRAGDRLGRLHDLASALDRLGLSVYLAKIDTLGERVLDVFFVRGRDGQKLDKGGAAEVRRAMLAAASA